MKHLVIALIPTVIGAESYVTKVFIGASEKINGLLELPNTKTKLQEWDYLEDDLINAGFEKFESIKTNGKPNPFNLTIHEFVLGTFGLLSALYYDEAGKITRKAAWELTRG